MVFSSIIFLFGFLPSLLGAYALARRFAGHRISNLVLLAGSMLFIIWGSGRYTLVLVAIILVNFAAGSAMAATGKDRKAARRSILAAALVISLGLLIYFKYAVFVGSNIANALRVFNVRVDLPPFIRNVVLPLGISFYTFQAISYSVDVYRGIVEPSRNIIDFALYVSFFPQLIAGPIVRYKDICLQLGNRKSDLPHVYEGTIRFMTGMSKKVLLANITAGVADGILNLPAQGLTAGLAWLGMIAYTLQIYLDFSAYSDMAIGLASILGFDLLENFNYPYISQSVREFWTRWHISLSNWLKDYLYIPLGGNRKGTIRTYINLTIVYLLCGLWHGAAWTFVAWGLFTGCFLVLERAFIGRFIEKVPRILRHLYTMMVFMLGLVFFRSPDIAHAFSMFGTLFTGTGTPMGYSAAEFLNTEAIAALVIGAISSIGFFRVVREKCRAWGPLWQNIFAVGVFVAFILSILKLYGGAYNPFIYFRF